MAHRGDQIPMSSGLQPQDAEAVVRFVKGDPFDEASQEFDLGVALMTH
jgi:hypothetical protein